MKLSKKVLSNVLIIIGISGQLLANVNTKMSSKAKLDNMMFPLEHFLKEINKESSNIVVIDVRLPMEWRANGVLNKSTLLSFYDVNARSLSNSFIKELRKLNINNAAFIVLVCNSGLRSKRATLELNRLGFNNIKYLEGGINKWKKSNLPLIDVDEE